jgi:hypothetical protein
MEDIKYKNCIHSTTDYYYKMQSNNDMVIDHQVSDDMDIDHIEIPEGARIRFVIENGVRYLVLTNV